MNNKPEDFQTTAWHMFKRSDNALGVPLRKFSFRDDYVMPLDQWWVIAVVILFVVAVWLV